MFFYRDKDGREIDLLIEAPDGIHPVEFKMSATPKAVNARSFEVLERLNRPIKRGALVCNRPEIVPLPNRNVDCIPASLI